MKGLRISQNEKRKYVLKERNDLIILKKIKLLEKEKLYKTDKEVVKLIKTQLKKEWRKPLIKYLDKLIREYKK